MPLIKWYFWVLHLRKQNSVWRVHNGRYYSSISLLCSQSLIICTLNNKPRILLISWELFYNRLKSWY